ncbi:MAG: SufE family protein [Rhodospirillaceae bacterium]|nr:SufE family protein [Rhodospirillaceae bacterium]
MTLDDIIETFEFLDDWDDRFAYLIELGKKLPGLPDDAKTEANKVHGCTSQVWMVSHVQPGNPPCVAFEADSDAFIVRGLIAILMAAYSGQTARHILDTDIGAVFERLSLGQHLSANRQNGFFAMTSRIKAHAREALEAA